LTLLCLSQNYRVEHFRNAGVGGSNPFRGTSLRKRSAAKAVAPKPILGEGGPRRSLLLFALRTALRASREIGSFGVITHPIDDRARAFYRRWGFQDLPFDPRRAMIVRMVDLERNGIDQ